MCLCMYVTVSCSLTTKSFKTISAHLVRFKCAVHTELMTVFCGALTKHVLALYTPKQSVMLCIGDHVLCVLRCLRNHVSVFMPLEYV